MIIHASFIRGVPRPAACLPKLLLLWLATALLPACATQRPADPAKGASGEPSSPAATVRAVMTYDAAMAQGDEAFRAGEQDRALYLYGRAAELEPSKELPLLRAAAIQESRRQPSVVRQLLVEAVRRQPADAAAHEHLGYAQLRLDEVTAASQEFAEALRLDGTRWRSHMGLGLAARLRQDPDAARRHFDEALALRPRSAELLTYSAELWMQMGRNALALADVRAALAIGATPSARLLLGDLLCRSGDYPGGLEAYLGALDEPAAYLRLGEEAMRATDYARALRYFHQSADSSPTFNEQVTKRIAVARERVAESSPARPPAPGS